MYAPGLIILCNSKIAELIQIRLNCSITCWETMMSKKALGNGKE